MYVKYPIMGLTYARDYFAICGGGGSLKSGIPNSVDIYQLNESDPSGFVKEITVETGTELASGCAFSQDGDLIAVSVNDSCWIYKLNKKAKTMTLLLKFRTDFATIESTQTSVSFVGDSTLLTGGEDGVVRVWSLSNEPSAKDKAARTSTELVATSPEASTAARNEKTPSTVAQPRVGMIAVSDNGTYMATLTREYRGHSKRIREIHVEPSHRNLVASSSEDQSCHLWRLNERTTIYQFNKDDALDTVYQMLQLKPLPNGIKKHQFRCVRFANDGRSLFTVLTPPRGDTVLIKWAPRTLTQQNESEWPWMIVAATVTGDRPVAGLCVSDDDRFVGCAAVSGDVRVYESTQLRAYKMLSTEDHSFAITGMSFVPTPQNKKFVSLVTGGADKKLLRHLVPVIGGELSHGGAAFFSALGRLLGGIITLILSLLMGMILLFVVLLGVHAKKSLLLRGPLCGYEDLMNFQFETPDALVTLVVTTSTMLCAWIAFLRNSVTSAFFWNGILCFVSMFLSFVVAISPDLQLQWKTGDAPFDELLDYKIPIILGACCIVFFFSHSILIKLDI